MKKVREKPKSLCVMECLRGRMAFSKEEERSYWQGVRGYEGECCFDSFTKDFVPINDLTIKEGQTAQLDTLLVTEYTLYLFDVKNFDGQIMVRDGILYHNQERLVNNPLERLERAKVLLEKKLLLHHIRIPVVANLVFINPDMIIYGHHPDLPILLHPQIKPYLEKISRGSLVKVEKLAQMVADFHTEDNPYTALQMMKYEYDNLKKGIFCPSCRVSMNAVSGRTVQCRKCAYKNSKTQAFLRMMDEYHILFPDKKVSVQNMYEWCGGMISKRTIHTLFERKK